MAALTDSAIDALRRDEFPLPDGRVYLDFATFGLLPAGNVRAARETLARTAREGSLGLNGTELLEDVRAEAATLLHCAPGHVCLLTSTSEGMGLLAEGVDWRPGDEILLLEHEFEGCLAPFRNVRGVSLRFAETADEVADLVGPRTRAVALSLVDRVTGARAPVEDVAAACRGHGAWLAFDAAQAMGVLDLDVTRLGADIVSAHGYKFLLSGFGLAPTYCSDRALAELRAPRAGWKNAGADRDAAARFEPTMGPLPVLAGMRESLRLLNTFDAAERERRALGAARAIAEGLGAPAPRTSLVSVPGLDAGMLVSHGIVAATVEDRLRLSTHFFTTQDDVDRLLAAL